jgi:GNAT superfamily N-acetyltransferase
VDRWKHPGGLAGRKLVGQGFCVKRLVHAMSDGSPAKLQWRPMVAADLPAVDRLSARIHPDYPERPEVLAEKFRLFPRGCFVLDRGPEIHGYCFSHPWTAGPPPALDTAIGALPDTPDAYFIHDIALDQPARGMALASLLVPMLTDTARGVGIGRMMLVAVGGSEPFWTRMEFCRTADVNLQAAARALYGEGAVQMERAI